MCGRGYKGTTRGMAMHSRMRHIIFVCIALAPGVAAAFYQTHGSSSNTCFALSMVGFGNQSNRRQQQAATKTKPLPPKPVAEAKPPLTAGELPDDAFSQFPPLSAQQESTLQKAEDALPSGDGTGLPAEVCVRPLGLSRSPYLRSSPTYIPSTLYEYAFGRRMILRMESRPSVGCRFEVL